VAWTGTWPGTDRPLRVEAAALHGKPVFFSLIGPWTKAPRVNPFTETRHQQISEMLLVGIGLSVLSIAVLMARRNYQKGRSDLKGAARLATFVFAAQMLLWILRGHFVPSIGTFGLFVLATSTALFMAGFVAALYIALEPYVRRRWPQTIISWSRLLLGRWRDPLVGRDLLYGLLLGAVWILIFQVFVAILLRGGDIPQFSSMEFLLGPRQVFGAWMVQVPSDVQGTLLFFFIIFVLRVLLRNQWLAAAGFVLLFAGQQSLKSDHVVLGLVFWGLVYALAAIAVVRFGLVCLAAALFITDLLLNLPMTSNFGNWFIGATIFTHVSVFALALWAFYTALAGQRLWKEELFE
jgi:serine/threonine-protein kinase